MNDEARKKAEANTLTRMGSAILRKPIYINWLSENDDELGYTQGNECVVYVAWKHKYMNDMDSLKRTLFRTGIFSHELLHQRLTNFKYTESICKQMLISEAKIFMLFANTLEDPAIEYFSPQILRGTLLDGLKYTIKRIYEQSSPLESSQNAFQQLINALIQFGDMGLLKGNFTFPEAREYFVKISPLYNEGIECINSRKRMDIAKQCMEICRPLWETQMKDDEQFKNMIDEMSKNSLNNLPNADMDTEKKEVSKDGATLTEISKQRKNTLEKINEKKAQAGKLYSESSQDNIENNNDIISENEIQKACIELQKIINNEVKKEIQKLNEEKNDIEDFEIEAMYYDNISCINKKISISSNPETWLKVYQNIKAEISKEIRIFTKTLQNLIKEENVEQIRSTSGKYNIKRGSIGTTAKIFDKKKDKGISDIAIEILIDQSGSMGKKKLNCARKTAIIIAESCAANKIPCYILGFRAGVSGHNVEHDIYVTWKNTQTERASLALMSSGGYNFDGYSIRYAKEIIKKKSANNKLIFVISDGTPSWTKNANCDGIKDCKDAINETRKAGVNIFGIGIGDCSPQILNDMYGKDFIHVKDESFLSSVLCKKIKKLI